LWFFFCDEESRSVPPVAGNAHDEQALFKSSVIRHPYIYITKQGGVLFGGGVHDYRRNQLVFWSSQKKND
jgi:hypothetical protein